MANDLDELNAPEMPQGNDVKVIAKQLPVKVGVGSKIFDIIWWILPIPIIGGLIWNVMKVKAKSYFLQLQQKLQHDASQVDNYLEQRVQILTNCAQLVNKATDLDKSTFENIAKYRSGAVGGSDEARNECASELSKIGNSINVALENYPELKAHKEIADAMQQNSYLQKEITAAREVFNDTVNTWNREVYHWPTRMIVAAKAGYTTRIPFIADEETKKKARSTFFN